MTFGNASKPLQRPRPAGSLPGDSEPEVRELPGFCDAALFEPDSLASRRVEQAHAVAEQDGDDLDDDLVEQPTRQWGDEVDSHELDFRVGGRELQRGVDPHGNSYTFHAIYQDIVPGRRIVYTYEMLVGETRISVSLATVELLPDGDGTRLVFTEQGAFLDGYDTPAQRRDGIGSLLDALGAAVS